jgi:hypothetical protein
MICIIIALFLENIEYQWSIKLFTLNYQNTFYLQYNIF